jgi:hypothetical protein
VLHRINPPSCVSQLEQLIQFQRSVLVFSCRLRLPLTFKQEYFENVFGVEIGQWLWKKLWVERRETGATEASDLQKALHKFAGLMTKNPVLETSILAAFDHDINFHHYVNDSQFTFSYNSLNKQASKVIKELLELFSTELLASGFPETIHGDKGTFDRDRFVSSFWQANPKLEVCPACDRPRSPMVDNKIFSDADHFFPKSRYPFLSIHHANLVPLCLDCNRTKKGNKDPIDDKPKEAPLLHTFHPYLSPAIEQVDIKTNRNTEGVRIIQIEDKAGMPSRRVESLNRVFKLEKEWLDGLRYSVDSIIDEVQSAGERLRRLGIPLSPEELKTELEDMLRERIKKRGQRHYYVLHSSYLEFAIKDLSELDELFAQFSGT